MLWLRYTLLFAVFAILICVCQGDVFSFSWRDAIDLFSDGVCQPLDVVNIKGNKFGISVLWFLYAGFLAFVVLYLINRYIWSKAMAIAMILLLLVSCAINCYHESVIVSRVFAVALPFVYFGMMLKKHNAAFSAIRERTIIALIIIFIVTLYTESLFYSSEVYFSTIPLTLLIFIYLIKKPNLFGTKMNIPVKVSMDIYIWHRLIYAILFGCFSLGVFKDVAAVVVYCFAFLLFTLIRKYLVPALSLRLSMISKN